MAKLTEADFYAKWVPLLADNDFQNINGPRFEQLLADLRDSALWANAPNVPAYAENTPYSVGFLVRYSQAGGRESFYYALQAGLLPHPTYNQTDANWKVVPGPVPETVISQAITLLEAQGIDGNGVVRGRRYGVLGKWNGSATEELVEVDGLENYFRRRGTLVRDDATQLEVEVDLLAATYKEVTAPASAEKRSVHATSQGLRTTGSVLFQHPLTALAVVLVDNVNSLSVQVNYRDPTRPSIWVAGAIRNSTSGSQAALAGLFTQVLGDVQAIPAAGLALAGELLLRTQAIDTTLPSNFFLDGAGLGYYQGLSRNFRTTYSGPPVGNLYPNSQFQNTNEFWITTGNGWAYGNGQASTVNGNPSGHTMYSILNVVAGTYRLTVGILALNSPNLYFDIEAPQGTFHSSHYLSALGDNEVVITVPSGGLQLAFRGPQDAVLNHVYLVAS